jgi:RNA polymerase sigma factor (sigma-70 family)
METVAVCPTRSPEISSAPQQAAVVNRINSGDANARFRSVVLPHLDDAYRLARALTGSRADSEDVVQDACLRALRGIGNFSNGNARAWVLTIVRHTAYSWLHKNRPAALVPVDDIEAVKRPLSIELGVQTPETALIAQDDATTLEAVIAALPAPFRETLALREVQELSYREIAEVTGVSIGTVMSRLARARGGIISIMTKAGPPPKPVPLHERSSIAPLTMN